jgi:hypothetical protein
MLARWEALLRMEVQDFVTEVVFHLFPTFFSRHGEEPLLFDDLLNTITSMSRAAFSNCNYF